MGQWLSIVANILQIVTSGGIFVAVFKWGRDIMSQIDIWWIALLVILILSVIVSCLDFVQRLGWFPTSKLKTVSERHFKNETVVLDSHAFYNCIFENVTLTYGRRPYLLVESKIYRPRRF
jgi:ABC-type dipeptide/oligopeptide/nickel transport system permease component